MLKFSVHEDSPLHRKTLRWAFPGLALQIVGETLGIVGDEVPWLLAGTIYGIGTLCLVVGLVYMARSKNRSPAWGLLGALSLVGWILVAWLEDRSPPSDDRRDAAAKRERWGELPA